MILHSQVAADQHRTHDILHIVPADQIQRDGSVLCIQQESSGINAVGMLSVRDLQKRPVTFIHQFAQDRIAIIIEDLAAPADNPQKNPELFLVTFKSAEQVHMIPGNPGQERHVWTVLMELRGPVNGRREVFVPLEYNGSGSVSQFYHAVEAVDRGSDHVIEIPILVTKDMHDHRRDG